MNMMFTWEENFPKGYGHTSIAYLKRCHGFNDAKNGDITAAQFVVSQCIKQNRLSELRKRHPNATLLPVLCKNKLPLALAQMIGLPIWQDAFLVPNTSRKFLCAMLRLLQKPVFIGTVNRGIEYILVDDIVTQGGTISELRKHVLIQGGRVVAVVALAYAIGSHTIAPVKSYIVRLLIKFGPPLILLLHNLGIATTLKDLTNSQAKYLLKFASVGNILKRLFACGIII